LGIFATGKVYADKGAKMSKSSTNNVDSEMRQVAEPTKSIVRCCEMRKNRERQFASLSTRQRASSINQN
jgi:hypothetical protein